MLRAWWLRRGIRTQLVLSAAVPLAVALVVGTGAVALLFSASRLHDLDAQTLVATDTIRDLVGTGQLPAVLPLPAGSPLLAQVVAADGTVLAASPSASRVVPLIDSAQARPRQVVTDETDSYAGVPLRTRSEPAAFEGAPIRIVVAAPLGDVRRALHALRLVLLFVVPVLVLLTTSLVYRVAGLALRPVERLRRGAEAAAAHPAESASLPVPPGGDEIARLATTLNTLLGSLHGLLMQQKAFVADAAHELRSPLAALKVQLDVAQAHPDTAVGTHLLHDLGQEVDRLARLVDDLLALARSDAGGGTQAWVQVEIRALAGAQGDRGLVRGDPDALRRMVGNLVSNARRYGDHVQLTCSHEDGIVVLDVDDDGPGIPAADRERVFDRWMRLDPARSRDEGGAGLGLALARDIARRHGGDITAADSPLGGARLHVTLPADERRSGTPQSTSR